MPCIIRKADNFFVQYSVPFGKKTDKNRFSEIRTRDVSNSGHENRSLPVLIPKIVGCEDHGHRKKSIYLSAITILNVGISKENHPETRVNVLENIRVFVNSRNFDTK